ncbi:HAD family hydrolase [Candidatus Woesearchaeota archaeon]|nr:HAD family hydrolase [Candidatus Woesearchaeota archaeon]
MLPTLLLDVDGTLAQFNNSAGAEKVAEILIKRFGSKGRQAGEDFLNAYKTMNLMHHGKKSPEHAAVMDALNSYTIKLPPELGQTGQNFMWSRELWLKYASELRKLNLTWNMIIEIVDSYWETASINSPPYPEVRECIEKLAKQGLRLFLMTASDHRLTFRNGAITYEPKVSEQKKIKRVLEQGFSGIFKPQQIITGDPFNKPSMEFWQKCIKIAGLPKPSEAMVVDDAEAVVISAVKFGLRGCVLDRAGHYSRDNIEKSGISYITELNQLRP